MFNSAKDMVRGMFKARGILCAMLLCGLSLLTAGQALAQSFPSRPVTVMRAVRPRQRQRRDCAQVGAEADRNPWLVSRRGEQGRRERQYRVGLRVAGQPGKVTITTVSSTSGIINQITNVADRHAQGFRSYRIRGDVALRVGSASGLSR